MKKRISNTCILVAEIDGNLYMAGDRRVAWGFDQAQSMPTAKVNKRQPSLMIGATGHSYLCGIIVDLVEYPKVPARGDAHKYLVEQVIPAIKKKLAELGYCSPTGKIILPASHECEAVFCIKSRVFSVEIGNDFDTDLIDDSYSTIVFGENSLPYGTGCGGQWAWGAIDTILDLRNSGAISWKPEVMMRKAMKVAAKYSPGCDSKIDVISNKTEEKTA